ncbi:unnamed protein product [Dibothriocephalus latus]|uniref:Uncharacterized protein n=1 Tax=Dibothriocephalus latus TaxID=60516 RepID=A0A3P7LF24_DIBLA|nr:unnamed protein product [Dibothriocephalus latus]
MLLIVAAQVLACQASPAYQHLQVDDSKDLSSEDLKWAKEEKEEETASFKNDDEELTTVKIKEILAPTIWKHLRCRTELYIALNLPVASLVVTESTNNIASRRGGLHCLRTFQRAGYDLFNYLQVQLLIILSATLLLLRLLILLGQMQVSTTYIILILQV